MCECVWLMIVVGCVSSLGEEYVCGCGCSEEVSKRDICFLL